MPDALTDYSATELLEWIFAATDVDPAPSNTYLTLLDSTGADLAADLDAARLQTAPADWSITGSDVDNAAELSLGNATADISDITYAALFDAASGGNELLRTTLPNDPTSIATGTEWTWEVGDLTFDAVTFDE